MNALYRFKFAFLILFLITGNITFAEEPLNESFFKEANTEFTQENYSQSKEKFLKILEKHPNDTNVLFNLGLTELKLENFGSAAAYWRRVLHLNPFHSQAQKSLTFISKKLPNSHSHTSWENFRKIILNKFPLKILLILFSIFFVFSGLRLIKYFMTRYLAFKKSLPLPSLTGLEVFCSLICTLLFCLLITKFYDQSKPRGTLISDSSKVFLSPSSEDISIEEIVSGSEFVIDNTKNDWAKIILPSGTNGWILKKDFFVTSGEL